MSDFKPPPHAFLPTSRKELEARGWDNVDIILFSGDAYIDHPSFGIAIIGRVLEAQGYRVAMVPQPNWRDDLRDFTKLGRPRLFFGVGSGSMDSMVNHYTAGKRLRSNDSYTPEGKAGMRPDRAVEVYSRILKQLYPDVPVVIGGIEASLRRLSHYDYWEDAWKPSILIESGADYLVYGMGERAIKELAQKLRSKATAAELRQTPQIAYMEHSLSSLPQERLSLRAYEQCLHDKQACIDNFNTMEREANRPKASVMVEPVGQVHIVVNPPYPSMTSDELDAVYDLPFTRLPHPRYKTKHIPAYEMIKHSICLHRGCFGGCSFCTIAAHQGKQVVSRSEASVLREVRAQLAHPDFKGVLSDLGGPTANMYGMQGKNKALCADCIRSSCLFPGLCPNMNHDHSRLTALYRMVRQEPGIRHAFVGSGIRYDLFLDEHGFLSPDGQEYFEEVLRHHLSGRLKVAPEHTQAHVLHCMEKPSFRLFERLKTCFDQINLREQLKLKLIPYFISGHPACTQNDMADLAQKLQSDKMTVEQVQDFCPTPMTRSSVLFYAEKDPKTGKKIFVEKNNVLKNKQKSYFFKKNDD
ncbi:MAG: YgiQ family radical SAM protein [Bacteroidales bacterium]|nr:YgiQ family radical SAM protein [Bacteroidales bacterium]